MFIEKIYGKNYKSIKEWELIFSERKTVLVWKNNAGKSNFLSILDIFFSGKYPTYQSFDENDFYDLQSPIELKVYFSDGKRWGLKITYNQEESKAKVEWDDCSGFQSKTKEDLARSCSCIYIPSDRNINQHLKNNTYSWYWKLLNLILQYKKEKPEYKAVISDLQKIQTNFSKLLPTEDISRISQTLTYINTVSFGLSEWTKPEDLLKKVEIFVDDGSGDRTLGKFWTWTQSTVILWLLELYLKVAQYSEHSECKIFIIDEPENFLHPHAKRLLDNVLHNISLQENTQIIYSTHSSELIANFEMGKFSLVDLRLIYKQGQETKVRNLPDQENILHELNAYNSEVFFSDWIILVEGNTEKIMLPQIFFSYNRISKREILPPSIISILDRADIDQEEKNKKVLRLFDINLKNISLINVEWSWSLKKWYQFCSSIVWKENVYVILDKDIHLPEANQVKLGEIYESISMQYGNIGDENKTISNLWNYNRYLLDGEFEFSYKQEVIYSILKNKIIIPNGIPDVESFKQQEQERLSINLKQIYDNATTLKFSSGLEKFIWKYFPESTKPGISKLLAKQLIDEDGFQDWLLKILVDIVVKINNL